MSIPILMDCPVSRERAEGILGETPIGFRAVTEPVPGDPDALRFMLR